MDSVPRILRKPYSRVFAIEEAFGSYQAIMGNVIRPLALYNFIMSPAAEIMNRDGLH